MILWVVRLYCRYGQVIRELKREGKSPSDIDHRHVKYLNNVFEAADHAKLKRLIKPTLGFEAMKWEVDLSRFYSYPYLYLRIN